MVKFTEGFWSEIEINKVKKDFNCKLQIFRKKCKFPKPLSANPTKRSKILKQFVASFPTSCFNELDHSEELALKGLSYIRVILNLGGLSFFVNFAL